MIGSGLNYCEYVAGGGLVTMVWSPIFFFFFGWGSTPRVVHSIRRRLVHRQMVRTITMSNARVYFIGIWDRRNFTLIERVPRGYRRHVQCTVQFSSFPHNGSPLNTRLLDMANCIRVLFAGCDVYRIPYSSLYCWGVVYDQQVIRFFCAGLWTDTLLRGRMHRELMMLI